MNVLGNRKAGAVGRVLDGVTVHILDPEGNSLPVGEEGEICCRYVVRLLYQRYEGWYVFHSLRSCAFFQWAKCDER